MATDRRVYFTGGVRRIFCAQAPSFEKTALTERIISWTEAAAAKDILIFADGTAQAGGVTFDEVRSISGRMSTLEKRAGVMRT